MLRHTAGSVFVACTFAGAAWAEGVGLRYADESFPFEVDAQDPAFQSSVIAAADSDWRETPGADVWRLSFDGLNLHVLVFPTLYHPVEGDPDCCVSFTVGDTEFWVMVRPAAQKNGGTTHSPDDSSGRGKTGSHAALPYNDAPAGNVSGLLADAVAGRSVSGPIAGGPAPSWNAPAAALDQSTGHDGVSVAAVPEPSLLPLLAIGLAGTAGRFRNRRAP
jgi:hypothetical protein